jgi:hypothetical protein
VVGGDLKSWQVLAAGVFVAIALLVQVAKPTGGAAEPAQSASAFVDSVGVNTHLSYFDTAYSQYTLVREKLGALGVRHVRDKALLTNDQRYNRIVYDRYQGLAELGIELNLIVDPRAQNLRSVDARRIGRIAEMAGPALGSFEGPNEYDMSGDGDWVTVLRSYQQRLYEAVKGNASTRRISVIGPSFTSGAAYAAVGDLSASVDYGNMHNYYAGHNPGTDGWGADGYGSIAWNLSIARKYASQRPTVSTETGYHNAVDSSTGHAGTPEVVAGRYVPRLFLEHFSRGIVRTYAYELIDQKAAPASDGSNPENHFGLLRNDGTEKPAYVALKNLIGLLEEPPAEPGDLLFTPGALNYSLFGETQAVHRLLLQKRDGRFYLILWQEVPSYNPNTKRALPVPDKKVTLTLEQPFGRVTIYRPNVSDKPTAYYANPEQLELGVPDHPLVVELTSRQGSVSSPTVAAPQDTAPAISALRPARRQLPETVHRSWQWFEMAKRT